MLLVGDSNMLIGDLLALQMTADGEQRGVATWGEFTGDALLVAQTQKHPQYPVKKTKLWPQEEKHPNTRFYIQPCCVKTRISKYVIIALRSLSSHFSENSYHIKCLATGSKRDTEDSGPSERVRIRNKCNGNLYGYD